MAAKLQVRIRLRLALLLIMFASTLFATISYRALIEKYHDVATINRSTRDELAGSRLKRIDIQLAELKTNLQVSKDEIERQTLVDVMEQLDVDRAVEELRLSDFAVIVSDSGNFPGKRLRTRYTVVTAPVGPVSEDSRQKLLAFVNAFGKLPGTFRGEIDVTSVQDRDREIVYWERALRPISNRVRLVLPAKQQQFVTTMKLPSRKWIRFSLRAFLLTVALLAVWLSTVVRRAHNQKRAVTTIESVGGRVHYDYEPTSEEQIRRVLERQKAIDAGKKPPTYEDGPKAPSWLVNRLGVHFFSSVRRVDLSGTFCTDNQLAVLQLLPWLKTLSLSHAPYITSSGLANLRKLDLETLVLNGNQYSDETGETGLSDSALAHVASLRSLKNLTLSQNRFSDDGLRHISNLTRLETLSLEGTKITASGIDEIATLGRLKSLIFPDIPIDDGVLKSISNLRSLEHLGPLDETVTDEGLTCLQGFSKLRSLDLSGTQITDKGLEALDSMSSLRHLSLTGTAITAPGLRHISNSTRLETLSLEGTKITASGIDEIATLGRLKSLSFPDIPIDDGVLKSISNLRSLEHLGPLDETVTDEGLACLQGFSKLRSLDLSGTQITDKGLEALGGLSSLGWLSLENTSVSDKGILSLRGLPIRSLNLQNTDVHPEAVQSALKHFKQISY